MAETLRTGIIKINFIDKSAKKVKLEGGKI